MNGVRTLKPELKQWLFERMGKPEIVLIHAALSCVGVKEVTPNGGKEVEMFQRTIGEAVGEAWCLSFVQSMIAYVEEMTGAVSPLNATEWVTELIEANEHTALWSRIPLPGSLALWRNPASLKGHVGIVVATQPVAFYTVEGNTIASAGNQRDGDGVYIRQRFEGPLGSLAFRGFLKPFL